jgi:L-seryl-tRNA(Ser) seleniumtransferase
MNPRRSIPAVEKVLQSLGSVDLPRPALVRLVRREIASIRNSSQATSLEAALTRIRGAADGLSRSRIQPVINGTGILVHTNLGRAPLGPAVIATLGEIGASYNNLEYDLTDGQRGGRAAYLEHNLAVLCGADAATVVNNGAAALILLLRHFTARDRKEVLISRGELIQIGGGFRIPEILEASGARLREVGTTNKTTATDYTRAIGKQTALILKVHRSNFFMGGFVESPSTEDLAAIAHRKRLPLIEDLGSGAIVATETLAAIEHEPTPAEVLRRGVDLVCFSGDKLLGGPQAGILAGKARHVAALKREPFYRALRCDKLILAALQTTVDLYLERAASKPASAGIDLPIVTMLETGLDVLRARASAVIETLRDFPLDVAIGTGKAQVGGGTLPRSVLPSVTLDIRPHNQSVEDLEARLRLGNPAVIGYPSAGRFKIDLRTVFPVQDKELVEALRRGITSAPLSGGHRGGR